MEQGWKGWSEGAVYRWDVYWREWGCHAHLSSAALKGDACFGADVVQVFLGALGQLLAQDLPHKGLVKGIVPAWRQKTLLTFHKGEERGPDRAWDWPFVLSTFSRLGKSHPSLGLGFSQHNGYMVSHLSMSSACREGGIWKMSWCSSLGGACSRRSSMWKVR